MNREHLNLKALCVGRHPYLSTHFARFFATLGIDTLPVVGLEDALEQARDFRPDVVIAEYELLSRLPLAAWEHDELISRTAVIAVSLTHRPSEAHVLDINGISGFLYLPLLDSDAASKIITAAAASSRGRYVTAAAAASPIGALDRATVSG